MDQDLCETENDTPLLIDSESDSIQGSPNVEETVDPSVCDTETEASTKEKYTRPPNLIDKAYSIDEAVLAVPLEPIPVTLEEKSPSITDDSTSEDDFVVIEDSSTMKDFSEDNSEELHGPVFEITDQNMMDDIAVAVDSLAGGDTIFTNPPEDVVDTVGNSDEHLINNLLVEGDISASDIPQSSIVYCSNFTRNTPCTSILRRPSCFDNSESVPESDDSHTRRVSFPDEEIMVSYREPEFVFPWNIDSDMSSEDILQVYQNSCKKHNTIELDSIKQQIQEIKNNTNHSATLNLSSINITSEVNETLEDLLKVSNFNTLILNDCKFTPATITEFLNMLEFYESVCHIEVRMKFEDEETWKCFCNACSNIKVLESISFKEMFVGDNYMRPLINTIGRNKNITILKFDGCTLVKLPSFYLVECLITNESLRELYLPSTGLYTKEADVIGRFLQLNFYLKVLDISNNFIGDRGLEVLAKGLCKQAVSGNGLSVLVVFNNQISEKSGPCISTIIKECTNLHTLNIGFNNLTDEVLIQISNNLPETQSLEGLGLQCTLLTCKGIQCLSEAIQKNTSLRKINLKGNKAIQISGVEKLCQALPGTRITKIEIDETNRSCNEAEAYKELVKQINEICTVNKTLESTNDEEVSNISKLISRKVSLSCDLRHVELTPPTSHSVASTTPSTKSRFSIIKVSDSNLTPSSKPKNRFRVTRVPPSPEEEEPSGKFANVRSSVSSNDSMDSLTALPLDTDSDTEH